MNPTGTSSALPTAVPTTSSSDAPVQPDREGTLFFVGTATTILRYGELTLLTDPNFLHRGQRAYLGYGLTAKRLTEPALSVTQLPPLDAVVLSHLHGDHWDRNAQRGLSRDTLIVTTPHAAKRLQWRGFSRALGLRTWGSHDLIRGDARVTITAMPGRHAPLPVQRLLPPVMGSMLEFGPAVGPPRLRVYLSGDTLLIEELREIPERYPRIHTAVLHLGGTRLPGGLMVTMDAVQGADLMDLLNPEMTIPIHFDDYPLFASPLADFRAELRRRGMLDRVRFVGSGDTVALKAGQ
jgi:L-ascorbate metabolism protein UlaG (beta-lactamase superfamily)